MSWRWCCCIITFAASSLSAQLFQSSEAARLAVSTDKRAYRVGEKIVATYRLQNVGNGKLFVPVRFSSDCPPKVRLITDLQDNSGKAVAGGLIGDCSPHHFVSILEKIQADSKLLSPGQQYAPEETFDTRGLEPGLYKVTARLTAWEKTDFTEADREELRQLGEPILGGTLNASVTVRLTR